MSKKTGKLHCLNISETSASEFLLSQEEFPVSSIRLCMYVYVLQVMYCKKKKNNNKKKNVTKAVVSI